MEVNSQLLVAGYERLTADPTGANLFAGRFWMRTDLATDQYRVYDGTQVEIFADTQSAQTFQNKILAGANIADYLEFDQQGSTPSTPAAGKNRIYFKTDGTPYTLDENGNEVPLGSGGGGSKNYFEDVDAEIDSTIGAWETDDGVGGSSAGLTLSISAVAGELLAGANSLKLVKDAADRNGHFIKVLSKAIDPSDRGRANYGSFEFRAGTGYVNSDLIFEVYDVTNAAVLYSGVAEDLELLNGRGRFNWVTYLEDTTAQVEFRVKINNANTNTFDAFFDEFKFGPAAQLLGFPTEDLINITAEANSSYLPVNTGAGLGVYDFYGIARRGEFLRIVMRYGHTGTPGSGTGSLVFPVPRNLTHNELDGVVRYPSKFQTFAVDHNIAQSSGADQFMSAGVNMSANAMSMVRMGTGSVIQGQHILASAIIELDIEIPIAEWTNGNLVNTNELSLQTTKLRASKGDVQSIANNTLETVLFNTVDSDDTGSYNPATGQFTCPLSGTLYVYGAVSFQANATNLRALEAHVNGVISLKGPVYVGNLSQNRAEVSGLIDVQKDDTVTIEAFQNSGGPLNIAGDVFGNYFHISFIPDYKTLGVVKNEEYLAAKVTSASATTAADTWTDSNASITLTPGEWDIGHHSNMFLQWVSGVSFVYASAVIRTAANAIINETLSTCGAQMINANPLAQIPGSGSTRITVTETTTYKLSYRCSAPAITANALLATEAFTGALTDPDAQSIIWARRVK